MVEPMWLDGRREAGVIQPVQKEIINMTNWIRLSELNSTYKGSGNPQASGSPVFELLFCCCYCSHRYKSVHF